MTAQTDYQRESHGFSRGKWGKRTGTSNVFLGERGASFSARPNYLGALNEYSTFRIPPSNMMFNASSDASPRIFT